MYVSEEWWLKDLSFAEETHQWTGQMPMSLGKCDEGGELGSLGAWQSIMALHHEVMDV